MRLVKIEASKKHYSIYADRKRLASFVADHLLTVEQVEAMRSGAYDELLKEPPQPPDVA